MRDTIKAIFKRYSKTEMICLPLVLGKKGSLRTKTETPRAYRVNLLRFKALKTWVKLDAADQDVGTVSYGTPQVQAQHPTKYFFISTIYLVLYTFSHTRQKPLGTSRVRTNWLETFVYNKFRQTEFKNSRYYNVWFCLDLNFLSSFWQKLSIL